MLLPFSTQNVLGLYGYIISPFYPYILPFKPGKVAIRTNNPKLSLVGKNSIESHRTYLERMKHANKCWKQQTPKQGPSLRVALPLSRPQNGTGHASWHLLKW